MKYWKLKFKGERRAEEIESDIGDNGGCILRIHVEGDETQVYFTAEKSSALETAKMLKIAVQPVEVSVKEVTKI